MYRHRIQVIFLSFFQRNRQHEWINYSNILTATLNTLEIIIIHQHEQQQPQRPQRIKWILPICLSFRGRFTWLEQRPPRPRSWSWLASIPTPRDTKSPRSRVQQWTSYRGQNLIFLEYLPDAASASASATYMEGRTPLQIACGCGCGNINVTFKLWASSSMLFPFPALYVKKIIMVICLSIELAATKIWMTRLRDVISREVPRIRISPTSR